MVSLVSFVCQVLELSMAVMGGVADAVLKLSPEELQENIALVRDKTAHSC